MKTAVVILNWNTEGFLREFLPGLIAACRKVEGAEVVVADNASSDGSMRVMKEEFPEVRTIVFEENLGFTGGYNEAFRVLRKEMPEYFVLINSDIEVTDDWLGPLVDWMDMHPECGACAPKLHSWQEREKFEYAGAAGGYLDMFGYPFCRGRVMKRLEVDNGQYDKPADVLWATGACLMVRSSVFEELGGLDGRFFAHMEEIDLCWRMQLHGYRVTVVPKSVVYHVGGGTLPAESPFKLRLNYRNNLLMLRKNLARTFALKMYREEIGKEIPDQVRDDVERGKDDVERGCDDVERGCDEGKVGCDEGKVGRDGGKSRRKIIEKAAAEGCRKAERRILARKCLDRLSAGIYLLTGKFSYFNAVCQAHDEYWKLTESDGAGRQEGWAEVRDYLVEYGDKSSVSGIYGKSIIFEAILRGDQVFGRIEGKDFYKI